METLLLKWLLRLGLGLGIHIAQLSKVVQNLQNVLAKFLAVLYTGGACFCDEYLSLYWLTSFWDREILDDEGNAVSTGEAGSVYFAGEESPFEYKDDPEKTAEARRGSRFTLGDIGRVDNEGYLYLLDRRADIIISGGVNIYPAEIESALLELPSVADCCAIGIPNDEWGEEVRAVIELVAPHDQADATTENTILEHCRLRLAAYQVPRRVDFVERLPRTEAGKLARRRIRDPYWAGRERRI